MLVDDDCLRHVCSIFTPFLRARSSSGTYSTNTHSNSYPNAASNFAPQPSTDARSEHFPFWSPFVYSYPGTVEQPDTSAVVISDGYAHSCPDTSTVEVAVDRPNARANQPAYGIAHAAAHGVAHAAAHGVAHAAAHTSPDAGCCFLTT